jgi:hypothetical protein
MQKFKFLYILFNIFLPRIIFYQLYILPFIFSLCTRFVFFAHKYAQISVSFKQLSLKSFMSSSMNLVKIICSFLFPGNITSFQ